MQCNTRGCKEQMTEDSREYVGKNASSGNDVVRIKYRCSNGHTFSEKVEVEGTSTKK